MTDRQDLFPVETFDAVLFGWQGLSWNREMPPQVGELLWKWSIEAENKLLTTFRTVRTRRCGGPTSAMSTQSWSLPSTTVQTTQGEAKHPVNKTKVISADLLDFYFYLEDIFIQIDGEKKIWE